MSAQAQGRSADEQVELRQKSEIDRHPHSVEFDAAMVVDEIRYRYRYRYRYKHKYKYKYGCAATP